MCPVDYKIYSQLNAMLMFNTMLNNTSVNYITKKNYNYNILNIIV